MSATSTPNDSPVSVQPLHNPSQAAYIPANQAPGMGAKALLFKKMAKSHNPAFISPTDNLMTPVTQKLNAARKKNFVKGAKSNTQLFAQPSGPSDDDEPNNVQPSTNPDETLQVDDENPF